MDALLRLGDSLEQLVLGLSGLLEAPEEDSDGASKPIAAARDLDHVLPAMAQRLVDLLSETFPTVQRALTCYMPVDKGQVTPFGGRPGGEAKLDVADPSFEPFTLPGYRPIIAVEDGLVPPIQPVELPSNRIDLLAAPPTPDRLVDTLKSALETPWNQSEGDRYSLEATEAPTRARLSTVLLRLTELEAFLGGAEDDFQQLLRRLTPQGRCNATASYLIRLVDVYDQYKLDYYQLFRARRALLDRRDPSALAPLVAEEELAEYLWARYGDSLASLLWRVVRTSPQRSETLR